MSSIEQENKEAARLQSEHEAKEAARLKAEQQAKEAKRLQVEQEAKEAERIKGYSPFTRNRKYQNMGGVASVVKKQQC